MLAENPRQFILQNANDDKAWGAHWLGLLREEYTTRIDLLAACCLYSVKLTLLPPAPGLPPLFALEAPSIRENYPPISLDHRVYLRQLRPELHCGQGYAFEASIWNINRVAGVLTLRCDALSHDGMWETGIFNVCWQPQDRHFAAMEEALMRLCYALANSKALIHKWLFPTHPGYPPQSNGVPAPHQRREEGPLLDWVDTELNNEQMVSTVLAMFGRRPIVLILIRRLSRQLFRGSMTSHT